MNAMSGIDRWGGLSALSFVSNTFPGAMPQAGIERVFGPPAMRQRRNPSQRGSKALDIVAEIEAEQALVAANRELITRFEKKIQSTLARVWGEE